MQKLRPTTRIENVVASVILNEDLDLDEIAATMSNIRYDPELFPAVIYSLKRPKTSTLIFRTGKMVCTGAKSVEEAHKAVKKIILNLKSADIRISNEPTVKIQNIVASADLQCEVNLEKAALTMESALYEPEQFPSIIHRMRDPKVVILIFGSGKIVITGAKYENQIEEAAFKVMKKLYELGTLRIPEGYEIDEEVLNV